MGPGIKSGDLLKAANAAEILANGPKDQAEEMAAMMTVFAQKEAIQIALMNQQLGRIAESHWDQERLPLTDEGHEFGRVAARVPRDLFFHLIKQNNFGWEGFTSAEGTKDLFKAHPQCRVKTVSGKTTVGYTGGAAARVNFGRGTMTFAAA